MQQVDFKEDYRSESSTHVPYLHLPWPSEVLFTLCERYPRQTGQHRRDCLGEDLG